MHLCIYLMQSMSVQVYANVNLNNILLKQEQNMEIEEEQGMDMSMV